MGLLDDIADVATGKKKKEDTHSWKVSQAQPKSTEAKWMKDDNVKQAWSNAKNMAEDKDFKTQGQIEAIAATEAAGEVVTDDGEEVVTTDGRVIEDKKKKIYTVGKTQVSERLYNIYQRLLNRGYTPEQAEKIIKLGVIEEKWADDNLTDLMSGEGIAKLGSLAMGAGGMLKGALTKQPYEHEFLGSAGAANIINQLHNKFGYDEATGKYSDPDGAQDEINRIISSNEGAQQMFGQSLKTGITPEKFEKRLVEANQGNKNFDKNYNKTAGAYWELNPPTTQGDMVDLANASRQEGFEWTKQNTQMVQEARNLASKQADQAQGLASLGGGGGGGDTTVPPADPNLMPSGTYLASQYNQALVPDQNLDPYQNAMYTGGPEQLHIAGGYWDPNKPEWVGSPWGTQNLWQGANPPMMAAEGGPVRAPSSKVTQGGGGLFDFKPYGF